MKRSIARRHRRDSKYTEILGGLTFYKVSKNLVYASFITLAAVSQKLFTDWRVGKRWNLILPSMQYGLKIIPINWLLIALITYLIGIKWVSQLSFTSSLICTLYLITLEYFFLQSTHLSSKILQKHFIVYYQLIPCYLTIQITLSKSKYYGVFSSVFCK